MPTLMGPAFDFWLPELLPSNRCSDFRLETVQRLP